MLAGHFLSAVAGRYPEVVLGYQAAEVLQITQAKNEPFSVPGYALVAAPVAGFVIGAIAGLYPAAKTARLSPTEALRMT